MLEFIKKLFREDAPVETEDLSLDAVEGWFAEKVKAKKKAFSSMLDNREGEIREVIADAREHISTLEKAELQNKNIPPKAFSFMEGNRDSYIRLMERFFSSFLGSFPATAAETKKYLSSRTEDMESLLKATQRNYQVLQEFFSHEARAVAQQVKKLEHQLKDIRSFMENTGMDALSLIEEGINDLKERKHLKEELEEEQKEESEKLEGIKRRREEILKEKKAFLESHEHLSYKDNREKKKEAELRLKKEKDALSERFSSLDKALKKYAKISLENEELATEYVYRPEHALSKDRNFEIVSILRSLKGSIENGSIALDEKKKQKAFEELQSIIEMEDA